MNKFIVCTFLFLFFSTSCRPRPHTSESLSEGSKSKSGRSLKAGDSFVELPALQKMGSDTQISLNDISKQNKVLVLYFANFSSPRVSGEGAIKCAKDHVDPELVEFFAINIDGRLNEENISSASEFVTRNDIPILFDKSLQAGTSKVFIGEATYRMTGEYIQGITPITNFFVISTKGTISYAGFFPGMTARNMVERISTAAGRTFSTNFNCVY